MKKAINNLEKNTQTTTWTTIQTSSFGYEIGTDFDFENSDSTYELKKFKLRVGLYIDALQLVFTDGSNNMKTVSQGGNGGSAY